MNKFFVAEGQVINLEAVICAKPSIDSVGLKIYLTDDQTVIFGNPSTIKAFLQFCVDYQTTTL